MAESTASPAVELDDDFELDRYDAHRALVKQIVRASSRRVLLVAEPPEDRPAPEAATTER